MKRKLTILFCSILLLLGACTPSALENSNSKTEGKQEKNDVLSFEHIHGITFSKDGESLFIATHIGLLESKDKGATWGKVTEEELDLMGFNVLSDGTLISSGHPGANSSRPNPLGLIKSEDEGVTWESISLEGQVDFHILVPNREQPDVMYGLNQMGDEKYMAGLYKSLNGGKEWTRLESAGLPQDFYEIYTIISISNNSEQLVAGTQKGLLRSDDGGVSWNIMNPSHVAVSLQEYPDETSLLSYSMTNSERGIMVSQDEGQTWEYLGLDLGEEDAIAYFSINPRNTNEIAAASFNNSIYFSTDGGATWKTVFEDKKS